MLKKRLIFTLLYNQGQFMLSRNFRLQKVGNLSWLQSNYNFTHIACAIDELIVLDVSRDRRGIESFCESLRALAKNCFVPIAVGGGVRTKEHARALLRSGADKVVINTPVFTNEAFVGELAQEYGQQCVVASIDIKRGSSDAYHVFIDSGTKQLEDDASYWIDRIEKSPVGEIYVNSIDRDGTGQGYDLGILNLLPKNTLKPIILAGGAGNAAHLEAGLKDSRVDAVATAHLFNFVGDGLQRARQALIQNGIPLPVWDRSVLNEPLLEVP